MAEAANKSSLASTIFPWSRSNTPPPKSPLQKPNDKSPALQQSDGLDHTISIGPRSLPRYPKDCPVLKARWYYAVDVPKRKPLAQDSALEDKTKPPQIPKRFVPFSTSDSVNIERTFQTFAQRSQSKGPGAEPTPSSKVPVNEDFLFDVDIDQRELLPAYWLGPVYEVRRGTWFYPEYPLRPLDEHLANQLEEGYLKTSPWRRMNLLSPRAASQPRGRPRSEIIEPSAAQSLSKPPPSQDDSSTNNPNTYRLFGAHMNTTVTYQDDTVAYLITDDFLSRMSSTVYGRFVGYGGTKVVRGWVEKQSDPPKSDQKDSEPTATKDKRKSVKISPEIAPERE